MKSSSLKLVLIAGSLLFILLMGSFKAQAANVVGGFSKEELKAVSQLLDRYGLIALAETKSDGSPKAMTLAVRVAASRQDVIRIFQKPEFFYYVSSLFKENNLLEEHDNALAYSWASRHKWFSFTGVNNVAIYPPRRVDLSIVKSSVGSGDFRFLLYELKPKQTLVVLSGILDVKSSDWLIRYLIGMNPEMRLAMNVAVALVAMKGIKTLAEQFAESKPAKKHRTRGKRKGPLKALTPIEIKALAPLLERGTVVLTESVHKGRLAQATAVAKVRAPGPKFLVAAATPEFYPKMIKAITEVKIKSRTKDRTEFDWSIGFPIFGLASRNELTFAPDGVLINGLGGDLEGALWRWQVSPTGPQECIVAYHGWADMNKAGVILEKSVKREPYLEHAFIAGSNMVMLRAVRRVVEGQPKK